MRLQKCLEVVPSECWPRPQLPHTYDRIATALMIEFELTNEKRLLDLIHDNLTQSMQAEANITGANSSATSIRQKKTEGFMQAIKPIISKAAT